MFSIACDLGCRFLDPYRIVTGNDDDLIIDQD
jgi:hypothetical protein